jgi:hypothetical protein
MPEIKLKTVYKVTIIESERGWGQKIDEVKYFDDEGDARRFVTQYNSELPPGPAPDWYMMAIYEGRIS